MAKIGKSLKSLMKNKMLLFGLVVVVVVVVLVVVFVNKDMFENNSECKCKDSPSQLKDTKEMDKLTKNIIGEEAKFVKLDDKCGVLVEKFGLDPLTLNEMGYIKDLCENNTYKKACPNTCCNFDAEAYGC